MDIYTHYSECLFKMYSHQNSSEQNHIFMNRLKNTKKTLKKKKNSLLTFNNRHNHKAILQKSNLYLVLN